MSALFIEDLNFCQNDLTEEGIVSGGYYKVDYATAYGTSSSVKVNYPSAANGYKAEVAAAAAAGAAAAVVVNGKVFAGVGVGVSTY